MAKKSDKIKQSSVSDKIRVAILSELEDLLASSSSGATETTLASILALMQGANKTLSVVEYTAAGAQSTTAGKNTVMITCVDGVEEIEGVIHPAGVYTFQPTGNDGVASISVNANAGRLIVSEL